MTDTPRTDAYSKEPSPDQSVRGWLKDWAEFARTLERELASQVTYAEQLRGLLEDAVGEVAAIETEYGDTGPERLSIQIRAALSKNPSPAGLRVAAEASGSQASEASGAGGAGTICDNPKCDCRLGMLHTGASRVEIARESVEAVSDSADFEDGTWTFRPVGNFTVRGGRYRLVPIDDTRTQSGTKNDVPCGWCNGTGWRANGEYCEPCVGSGRNPTRQPERTQVCNHGDLIKAVRALVFAARTSGGVAGRDETLCAVLDIVESLLPPMVGIDASDGDSRTVAGQKS